MWETCLRSEVRCAAVWKVQETRLTTAPAIRTARRALAHCGFTGVCVLCEAWARDELVANTGDEAFARADSTYAFRDEDPAMPHRRPDGPPGLALRWAARRIAEAAGCAARQERGRWRSWRCYFRLYGLAATHGRHPLLAQAASAYRDAPYPDGPALRFLPRLLTSAGAAATLEDRRAAKRH